MTLRRSLVFGGVSLLALTIVLIVAIGWLGSNQALRPHWYTHRSPEEGLRPMDPADDFFVWGGGYRDPFIDLGLRFEEVEFATTGGAILRGWYIPSVPNATAGVIGVHGGGADRREFLRQVPVFHAAGYPVLLFDCREQGISDGNARGISLGIRESEDVISAVAWAKRERGLTRVGVIGTSQGGASVILAAAKDPTIDVVIAENPFTSIYALVRDVGGGADVDPVPRWAARVVATAAIFRMGGLGHPAPIEVVDSIAPRPLLLMHGSKDRVIPFAQSERLREAAGDSTELWIVEGGEHSALFNHVPKEWADRVSDFLARNLGSATQ